MLCVGRIVNGGPVELRPTLEERLDAQIARNAEVLALVERERSAMHADLDALLAGKPVQHFRPGDFEAMDSEILGADQIGA